ncbi:MAG: bifunctional pyr operon transcriptional regulator/uracil phosphoribosyltransferase PyrR, partial [Thauera sp.]|nr:bifunctional pyr operon transcriptional regulator/uracil phosphoribosyltransferase PyrR [Thauera sp.]
MKDLDAEALCRQLAEQIRPHVGPATALVGIYTGGLWLAERLHAELGIAQPLG